MRAYFVLLVIAAVLFLSIQTSKAEIEGLGVTFSPGQNYTNLSYNILAVAQTDHGIDVTGPAYLVNGISSKGYWYQVDIEYTVVYHNSGTYSGEFKALYEVWNPVSISIDEEYFPFALPNGTSCQVNPDDMVNVEMFFSGNKVIMKDTDLNYSSCSAEANYSAFNATHFVGAGPQWDWTGLYTEWWRYPSNNESINEKTNVTEARVLYQLVSPKIPPPGTPLVDGINGGAILDNNNIKIAYNYGAYESYNLNDGTFQSGSVVVSSNLQSASVYVGKDGFVSGSVSVANDTGPYVYTTYLDSAVYSNIASSSPDYNFSIGYNDLPAGNHIYYVIVNDASGLAISTKYGYINVYTPPQINVSFPKTAIDAGQNISVSYSHGGGIPPYNISIYLDGKNVGNKTTFSSLSVGIHTIKAEIIDANGSEAFSKQSNITVNPLPSIENIAITKGSSLFYASDADTENVVINGGTPPYTYKWYANGVLVRTSNVSSGALNLNVFGNNSIQLVVQDAAGDSVTSPSEYVIVGYNYVNLGLIIGVISAALLGCLVFARRHSAAINDRFESFKNFFTTKAEKGFKELKDAIRKRNIPVVFALAALALMLVSPFATWFSHYSLYQLLAMPSLVPASGSPYLFLNGPLIILFIYLTEYGEVGVAAFYAIVVLSAVLSVINRRFRRTAGVLSLLFVLFLFSLFLSFSYGEILFSIAAILEITAYVLDKRVTTKNY